MRGPCLQAGHAVEHVDHEIEAIDLIENREFERRVDVAFFLIAAHVQILVIVEAIRELVNQPRITVKVEDHGFV